MTGSLPTLSTREATTAKWIAAAITALVAWRTRGVAWAVLAGMGVFLALK